MSAFGRLPPHVPLQTANWSHVIGAARPTGTVNPIRPVASVWYRAMSIRQY